MEAPVKSPKVLAPGEGMRVQVLAETGWLKLSGEETGGAYSVMEGHTPPGAGPPLHRDTREDESFYTLQGEYEFTVGGQVILAAERTFIFGPRGIPHTFKNIGKTPARILVIAQPAGIERFFEEVGQMTSSSPLDAPRLKALAAKYGIEILA